jgi:peptidoglycan/xylan/chitin deacetylase (PgdA/CDA1 family)
MYHQVGDHRIDPWALRVHRENFNEQMRVLCQLTTPLSLGDLPDTQSRRRLARPASIVTFDDGYADNLTIARPILERHDVPATIFVTTGAVEADRELWWDELAQIILHAGELPTHLGMQIGGDVLDSDLGEAATYQAGDETGWEGTVYDNEPNSRLGLYLTLWERLQPLDAQVRTAALDQLAQWASHETVIRESHRVMTPEELDVVSRDGLVEIGAHTVTHPLLPDLPTSKQLHEIAASKAWLETLLEREISSFSYPFGAHSADTVAGARQAGLRCACTTVEAPVHRWSDPHKLGRFDIRDWSGEEFESKLTSWLKH